MFRTETRDAFERLISQGWTRALRALHPEGTTHTYFDFRNLLGPGADLIAMRLQRGDGATGFARSTQSGGDGLVIGQGLSRVQPAPLGGDAPPLRRLGSPDDTRCSNVTVGVALRVNLCMNSMGRSVIFRYRDVAQLSPEN